MSGKESRAVIVRIKGQPGKARQLFSEKSKPVWYQLLKPGLSPGIQPARLHSRALFPPVLYKNIEFIEYSV